MTPAMNLPLVTMTSNGDGWLSRDMGGLVGSAPACYGSSLASNPDISQKDKMDEIGKGVAIIL
jgi:hypothetical protein